MTSPYYLGVDGGGSKTVEVSFYTMIFSVVVFLGVLSAWNLFFP